MFSVSILLVWVVVLATLLLLARAAFWVLNWRLFRVVELGNKQFGKVNLILNDNSLSGEQADEEVAAWFGGSDPEEDRSFLDAGRRRRAFVRYLISRVRVDTAPKARTPENYREVYERMSKIIRSSKQRAIVHRPRRMAALLAQAVDLYFLKTAEDYDLEVMNHSNYEYIMERQHGYAAANSALEVFVSRWFGKPVQATTMPPIYTVQGVASRYSGRPASGAV